jgi:hypothetical protein
MNSSVQQAACSRVQSVAGYSGSSACKGVNLTTDVCHINSSDAEATFMFFQRFLWLLL